MDYIILITAVIVCAGQTVTNALYGKKKDGSVAVGSLIIVFAISLFFFKERFEKWQYLGIFLGIPAIVLLQI